MAFPVESPIEALYKHHKSKRNKTNPPQLRIVERPPAPPDSLANPDEEELPPLRAPEDWTPESYLAYLDAWVKKDRQNLRQIVPYFNEPDPENQNSAELSHIFFFDIASTLVGIGDSASVVLALNLNSDPEHPNTRKLVAIKVFFPREANTESINSAANISPQQEAALMLQLGQGHLKDLFIIAEKYSTTQGVLEGVKVNVDSIIMEYLNPKEWQTLAARLEKKDFGAVGFFDIDRVILLAEQLSAAQEYMAANGIIHQDIKPGNLLLDTQGKLKVADFGIVQSLADAQDITKEPVGTLKYYTPEKIMSFEMLKMMSITEFHLGAMNTFVCAMIVFEALTGESLFPSDQEKDIFNIVQSYDFSSKGHKHRRLLVTSLRKMGVSEYNIEQTIAVFTRALARDPQLRYQSPVEFSQELTDALKRVPASEPEVDEDKVEKSRHIKLVQKLIHFLQGKKTHE